MQCLVYFQFTNKLNEEQKRIQKYIAYSLETVDTDKYFILTALY